MSTPQELVARVRSESGLSQRALARRAGCTRSTIVRIESGEMDPTVTMLARITAAAGQRLTIASGRPRDNRTLAAVAADQPDTDGLDWTRLRGLVDWLINHDDLICDAVGDPPVRTGDARVDNLLAAIAEKLTDDAGLPRPRWTDAVPALSTPWHAPGTPRMRAREAATAPQQFVRRNVLLGKSNLWRSA